MLELTYQEAERIVKHCTPHYELLAELQKGQAVIGAMTLFLALQELGYRIMAPDSELE